MLQQIFRYFLKWEGYMVSLTLEKQILHFYPLTLNVILILDLLVLELYINIAI